MRAYQRMPLGVVYALLTENNLLIKNLCPQYLTVLR